MARLCVALVLLLTLGAAARAQETIWSAAGPRVQLFGPTLPAPTQNLVAETLNGYLQPAFGWKAPKGAALSSAALNLVVGNVENNETLKSLAAEGLDLSTAELGDEGFRILSHDRNGMRLMIVLANTPAGLKFGCQELMYFRLGATPERVTVDWPLDVTKQPQVAYRGVYMLPIWSSYDSLDSWKRVLEFMSELTVNRVWFWLDGYPVAGHPASVHGIDYKLQDTPLANDAVVQGLIDLTNSEAMKFYIGGGWLSWHHFETVGRDLEKAREYYFDYLKAFKGVGGFYFEPTGEGTELAEWLPGDSLQKMIVDLMEQDPEFEVVVAIGAFNNAEYLEVMATLDPKRAFWWWCWGDPLGDKATEKYPSVLGWHTTAQMSSIHGRTAPPAAKDLALAGMATSFDPGMGYGNPWNGWAKMGVYEPRDFHPYSMPYFSHEYKFRERCWNVEQTDEEFAARMSRRLFDADMPAEAIGRYLKLAAFCPDPVAADAAEVDAIAAFVSEHAGRGTPRNQDTLGRMAEAVEGIRTTKAAAAAAAAAPVEAAPAAEAGGAMTPAEAEARAKAEAAAKAEAEAAADAK